MKSIYASKLYRASKRKDRIQAALIAPGNFNLVRQLADSLDEEYKTPENLGIELPNETSTEETNEKPSFIVDEEINPETDLVKVDDLDFGGSHSAPSHKSSTSSHDSDEPKSDSDKSDDDTPDIPADAPDIPVPAPAPAKDEAAASTKVTSCVEVDLIAIKDSLNAREDTHGVARVAEKENEVWIYYKDEVNLNNIMTDVIEYLMNAGFITLEFNRLARSDNAIVFEKVNAVGRIPVAAAISVGPVPPTAEVKPDPEKQQPDVAPNMSELKKAEQWIQQYKSNDTDQSQDQITEIELSEDCIYVNFKTHPKMIITMDDVKSGQYKQKIETAVEGKAVSTDVPDGSFQEILDKQ